MYGIYANIGGILMVNVTIYIAYMDPITITSIIVIICIISENATGLVPGICCLNSIHSQVGS